MTESKNIINFELDQELFELLRDNFKEEPKPEPLKTPFTEKEIEQIDRARLFKRWKKSEGYYYLNPEKFRFSLKNL